MNKKIKNIAKKVFKIITLGNAGVGKTSIIRSYLGYGFETNALSTIGLDFAKKEIKLKNKEKIHFQLIDTSGQEKYKSLSVSYLKHADGVLFVFALNNKLSFEQITDWIRLFEEEHFGKDNIPKYLVGNKCDLEKDIEVKEDSINNFLNNKKDMIYFQTSAKDNINIEEVFHEMAEKLYEEYKESGIENKPQIKLDEQPKNKKKRKECCNIKVEPDI